MTTGRITTALGAVALGLATAAAVPALAQTNTGGTNQPSATTSTPPATSVAPAAPATGTPGAATGSTSGQTNTAMPMGKTTHTATATHTHPMSRTHMATRETHHPMRHMARASESNPNAQDSAIDQLNQQSLQAAQQGKPFTPSGRM